jgi:glycosyltransferase involved in cell wall biosynthesis
MDGPGDHDLPTGQPVERDGVIVRYFRADASRRLAVSFAMRSYLKAHLHGFDLVHTHSVFLWPTWYAARCARLREIPYVMAPRGMLVPELIARRNRVPKLAWLRLMERQNLEQADALHFTSDLERLDAERLGIPVRRAVVIPNGIEAEDAPPAASEDDAGASSPYVLHLGRIHWKKGLDRLIRAMKLAPDLRAVFAGNNEDGCAAELVRLASDCGVGERIRWVGPVYGAEKWRLLRGARMLVLPSHSENFGNAVLEAMAAGVPVVVSPGVGLAAAVRESGCGIVVDPEPQTLAEALRSLWNDANLRSVMGEKGRALAEGEYAWPRIAARTAELYRGILDARGARRTGR